MAINTAAMPKDLLESELFGHERGSFTGAQQQRRGRFEQAEGGTLFLDEIGDMPAELQTRLLRVLSDGTYYRVGGHQQIKANVRIIAATHQDLETRVREGASLHAALGEGTLYPPLLAQLIAVGEESGRLGEFPRKAAGILAGRPQRTVERAVALIEPAMIIAFGVVVGLVALSLFQAIYSVNAGSFR